MGDFILGLGIGMLFVCIVWRRFIAGHDDARADRDVAESRLAEIEAAIAARCPWYDPEYAWCKRSEGVAECLPCIVQGHDGKEANNEQR